MRRGTLENQSTGQTLAEGALLAEGWFSRFVGWMGKRPASREAIGITRCDAVHTCLVPCDLDLVYCDRSGNVLRVVAGLPPGRLGPRVVGAWTVWEMAAGGLASRVTPGDVLVWRESRKGSEG